MALSIADIFKKHKIVPEYIFWKELPHNKELQAAMKALKNHNPEEVYCFVEQNIQLERARQVEIVDDLVELEQERNEESQMSLSRDERQDLADDLAKNRLKEVMKWYKENVLNAEFI